MANPTAGNYPQTNNEVNVLVAGVCRQFVLFQQQVARNQATMAAIDLKIAPYSFSSGDEANLKSALSGLNTALAAIDRTFIDRVTGFF
jgi:hypothetical protein